MDTEVEELTLVEWYVQEIQHLRQQVEELEIDLMNARGEFTTKDWPVFNFKKRGK